VGRFGETRRAYDRSRQGIREARLSTDWVSTLHPTRAHAQQAGMSLEAYRDFVYDACLPDGESGNDSAIHVDLITDTSEDTRLEIDGEVVQRDGRFRWEDGLEA